MNNENINIRRRALFFIKIDKGSNALVAKLLTLKNTVPWL